MHRKVLLLSGLLLACAFAFAQDEPQGPVRPRIPIKPDKQTQKSEPAPDQKDTSGQASSKESRGDTSAPLGDAQEHPDSTLNGPGEMHVWNPHKADKDVEIGDYHMKRKNYSAAESRYREALLYQNNNGAAIYGLAQVLEKQKKNDEAAEFYELYLKTLPHGPQAESVRSALQRLKVQSP
ncbi:MAG: tetratricopeptide repeat protein [Acidobacteria bacterium]|nr:tetratricopeptide repeat protein [Acidobacteriota bacterium]